MAGTSPEGSSRVLVAVAADGQLVAEHFSRAKAFVLAEVGPGEVGPVRMLSNPGRVRGGYGSFLADLGVKVVLAGSIGARSRESIGGHGIALLEGLSGSIEQQLRRLADSGGFPPAL